MHNRYEHQLSPFAANLVQLDIVPHFRWDNPLNIVPLVLLALIILSSIL